LLFESHQAQTVFFAKPLGNVDLKFGDKGARLPRASCVIKSQIESLASPRKLSGLRCSFAPLRMTGTLAKAEKSVIGNRKSAIS
jgi:hypothetical protein